MRPDGGEPGDGVHQHREERHDDDHGGLGLPVEAEPHHHDRRDADDRQRRDEVAERQEPAAAGTARGRPGSRPRSRQPQPIAQPASTALRKVCTKSAPQRSAASRRCGCRSRRAAAAAPCGTPRPTTTTSQRKSRKAPNRTGHEPKPLPGTRCAGKARRRSQAKSHAISASQRRAATRQSSSDGRTPEEPSPAEHARRRRDAAPASAQQPTTSRAARRMPAITAAAASRRRHRRRRRRACRRAHGAAACDCAPWTAATRTASEHRQRGQRARRRQRRPDLHGLAVIGAGQQPRPEAGLRTGRQLADDGADQADGDGDLERGEEKRHARPASAASRRSGTARRYRCASDRAASGRARSGPSPCRSSPGRSTDRSR